MSVPHTLTTQLASLSCAAVLAAGGRSTPSTARSAPARPLPAAATGLPSAEAWRAAAAEVVAQAAAAQPDGYEDCDPYNGALALAVTVRDSITGTGAAQSAVLAWRAGRSSGAEVWRPKYGLAEAVTITGPYGQPGTYDVTVRAPGYRVWHAAGVRVEPGEAHCSVGEPATVSVRLEPAPG